MRRESTVETVFVDALGRFAGNKAKCRAERVIGKSTYGKLVNLYKFFFKKQE